MRDEWLAGSLTGQASDWVTGFILVLSHERKAGGMDGWINPSVWLDLMADGGMWYLFTIASGLNFIA